MEKAEIDHLLWCDGFFFRVLFHQLVDELDPSTSVCRRRGRRGRGIVVGFGELAVVGTDRFHGFLDGVGAVGFVEANRLDVGAQEAAQRFWIAF